MDLNFKFIYLSDVDASRFLSLRVAVPEFGDGGDGVEASVLSQGEGDDLQGLGECPEAVLLHPGQGL